MFAQLTVTSRELTLPAGTSGILLRHHTFLRKQIARADELNAAIVLEQRPPLCRILLPLHRLFEQLRLELEAYCDLEQTSLFPSLLAPDDLRRPAADIAETLRLLEHGQAALASIISEIRELTHGYLAPVDACAHYPQLLYVLSSIDTELQLEFRLERHDIFPSALG